MCCAWCLAFTKSPLGPRKDNRAVSRHFVRFQHAIETGELILAGRTNEPGARTFGIAIFEAADEPAARKFMESDPAVVAGIMTAENGNPKS